MKTPTRLIAAMLAAGVLAAEFFNPLSPAHAQVRRSPENTIAEFDSRAPAVHKPVATGPQVQAEQQLKSRVRSVSVDYDGRLGTPKFIRVGRGFLTGPAGQGGAVSPATAQAFSANDPHRSVKAFLTEHAGLFGFGADALADAVVSRESVAAHSGLRTVVWQEQLDGLPVFDSVLIGNTTAAGELVSLASGFLPDPAAKADAGTPNRAALQANPTVSITAAIQAAAQNLGDTLAPGDVVATGTTAGAGYQKFTARQKPAHARLVWLPLDRDHLRLCWEVIVSSQVQRTMFKILVDAASGEVHVRRNLTRELSDATYNVWTSDSPSPFSPGWPTPNTLQPSLVGRTLVTTPALNTTASPNGWINDADNETQGNNTDTFTDRNFDQVPDGPRPQGNPNRVFNFPIDLGQDPLTYTNASTVQLFYLINYYHDRLYQLGFTESAGNFQNDNFGRGGLGNDRIIGYVQAGADTNLNNNAFFGTPPDGINGEMYMLTLTGPNPDRDGSFDAEVVFHEATHGTSQRLVGGGVLISALQTDGMGEGWGDFVGASLLSEPGDDVDGVYASGAYFGFNFFGTGFNQNYHFGDRHYGYTTDMSKNPFTFKDIDPAQISPHTGVPRSPLYGFNPNEANEVHHQGEIWCATLWGVRANLVNKHGYAGNELMLQLVIDGMKLGPANPNFLEARDAILLADQVNNGGANYGEIWRGFARRGMGISATSPNSSTTSGVHEAFDVPGVQIISTNLSGGNGNGSVDPNECNTLYLGLENLGVIGATGLQVTLSTTNANVIVTGRSSSYPNLPSGSSATNQIAYQFSTSPNFVCGTPVNFILTIKADQFTQSNSFTLTSGTLGAPLRYDSTGAVFIPDLSSADSPIVVSGFSSAVLKATLSLYITHTYDSDLRLMLISPDGVTNLLAANVGGSLNNFGAGCTDGARTTFDDDASLSIRAGGPPYIGSFIPEQSLANLIGKSGTNVNGTWHLHVVDEVGIDFGAIECWSLFLTPPTCTDGGGECPGSDLSIGGSVLPEPLIIGGNLVYSFTITNRGPKAAKGVTFTQSLPPSVTYIGGNISQGSISASGGTVNGNIGNLPVGGVVSVSVTVLPSQSGTLTSTAATAAVSDPDPDVSNNSVSLTSHVNPPTSDLAVGLVGTPNPVLVGGTLTYSIAVTNKGPSAATSVVVSNALAATVVITGATPSQGSAIVSGSSVIFNLGALNPGAVATATITVIPSAPGVVKAITTAKASQLDPVAANNTATVNTSVGSAADLAVGFQSLPASIVQGSTLTYTINATNLGPSTATSVFINQTLPPNAQVIFSNSTAGTTLSQAGGIITCDVGTLAIGGIVTMNVQVLVTNLGIATSTVNISGALADPVTANNSGVASVLVALPFVKVQTVASLLTAESLVPPNGAVDPGETVTVQLYLQNVGNISTTNLTGRLLATGGVTAPTAGAQSYGTLSPSAFPISKSFSFTASGTNGGTITATLQLTNNGTFLTNVSFVFALPKVATFANTNVIVIPDSGIASPYPSTITVSGVTGLVGRVSATLSNFNHTYPHDVSVLLVSPTGAKTLLMSHASDGGSAVAHLNLTFDDTAAAPLPDTGAASSGFWQPSAYPSAPVFPNPAPAGPHGAALSVFNSANPNGTWSLFVMDDSAGDLGGISNGWSLAITTISAINQVADLSLTGAASANPVVAGNNLVYTFTVTNNGTNAASAVAFTNTWPASATYVATTVSQGSASTNSGKVIANLGALAVGASATVTVTVTPTAAGSLVSTANVSATETDLIPANNAVTVNTTVAQPFADLAISKAVSANPVVVGSNLVYTISVVNNGPDAALNVVVTDTLPAGVSFASTSLGTFASGTLTANLGNLGAGAGAIITLTTLAVTPGAVNNTASAATSSTDSNLANNSASAGTVIRVPTALISAAGAGLVAENFAPADGTVAPGEQVTVSLALANTGEINTANLVATLLNTGGVTASSGSANYGVVVRNGAAVAQTFSFTASSAASGSVTATLQLQDGANNLGTVAFTFALPQTNSFANTNAIVIPDHGIAAPYPASISVAGLSGLVSKVKVTLKGVTHAFPRDIGIMLVSPTGTKSVVMAGAGAGHSITNLTLVFEDAAAAPLSDSTPILAGTVRPTSYPASRTFPSPAPAGAASALFSQLNSGDPNGDWLLYVVDDVTGDGGLISGGWSLDLTTVTPINPVAELVITSSANVSQLYVGGSLVYTLAITNQGPATATGVVVTNVLPAGVVLGPVTLSQGTSAVNAGTVVCSLNSLAAGSGATVVLEMNPTLAGAALNTALVAAAETDLNLANNATSVSSTVLSIIPARLSGVVVKPNNDFQLTLTGQPDLNYVIQATTNLSTGVWVNISTNTAAGNGTFQFTDTNAPGVPQRFYRAVVVP